MLPRKAQLTQMIMLPEAVQLTQMRMLPRGDCACLLRDEHRRSPEVPVTDAGPLSVGRACAQGRVAYGNGSRDRATPQEPCAPAPGAEPTTPGPTGQAGGDLWGGSQGCGSGGLGEAGPHLRPAPDSESALHGAPSRRLRGVGADRRDHSAAREDQATDRSAD